MEMDFDEWLASDECLTRSWCSGNSFFIEGARRGWDAAMEQQNKPTPKVKKWLWSVETRDGVVFTSYFYESEEQVRIAYGDNISRLEKIDFTEI